MFPTRRTPLGPEQRQREFLQGTPLVLIPTIFAFPAWAFFLHRPRFAHAEIVGYVLFIAFAVMVVVGVRKLVRCVDWREIDLIGALAFGVLLALFVTVLYAGVFVFALYRGDMGSM
jgi:predicted membrane channel-forming protein YqfA (hemolysin III family)